MTTPVSVNATMLRSQLVLTLASELVAGPDQSIRVAEIHLGELGGGSSLRLSSNTTMEGLRALVAGKSDFAIANPSSAAMLAYKGLPPFERPQPLRTIAVIPSEDQYVFAVGPATGLRSLEEIAAKRPPLRLSVRGVRDHCLHYMFDDIAAAAGFSLRDIETWGGKVRREGHRPPDAGKLAAFARGEIDAIFDEGARSWVGAALDAGMTILPLSEGTVRKLEALGYRRAYLRQAIFPKLAGDILTVDFSGWPIMVRADLPDQRVTQICAALEARKHELPWLPLAEMCRGTPAAPLDVPLHPAAERFWRERGYLP